MLFITDKAILVNASTGQFMAHGAQITATGGGLGGGSGFTSASSLALRARGFVVKMSADACGPHRTKNAMEVFSGKAEATKVPLVDAAPGSSNTQVRLQRLEAKFSSMEAKFDVVAL